MLGKLHRFRYYDNPQGEPDEALLAGEYFDFLAALVRQKWHRLEDESPRAMFALLAPARFRRQWAVPATRTTIVKVLSRASPSNAPDGLNVLIVLYSYDGSRVGLDCCRTADARHGRMHLASDQHPIRRRKAG